MERKNFLISMSFFPSLSPQQCSRNLYYIPRYKETNKSIDQHWCWKGMLVKENQDLLHVYYAPDFFFLMYVISLHHSTIPTFHYSDFAGIHFIFFFFEEI